PGTADQRGHRPDHHGGLAAAPVSPLRHPSPQLSRGGLEPNRVSGTCNDLRRSGRHITPPMPARLSMVCSTALARSTSLAATGARKEGREPAPLWARHL